RGGADARGQPVAVLALYRHAHPVAELSRHAEPAVRQCLWRHRHRLGVDRLQPQYRDRAAVQSDPRRRAAKSRARGGTGAGHDRRHLGGQCHLSGDRQPGREVDEMKSNRFWSWLVFGLGAAYFIIPLIATFEFSLRMRRGEYSFDAYASVFADPRFHATFGYSVVIGLVTIVVGVLVIVPAVYYVRLRMPWLRPFVEFVTLLPLVIPALILVYGYIRL